MTTAPAAILASSVSVRTLADGTLRLSVDIDPVDAQNAFALFGKPGSAIGLARITDKAAVTHDRARQSEPPRVMGNAATRKPLPLASKVALTCRDPEFHEFLRTDPSGFAMEWTRPTNDGAAPQDIAETLVKWWCQVDRKRDIDGNAHANRRWRELNSEFQQWLGSRELARRTGRAA